MIIVLQKKIHHSQITELDLKSRNVIKPTKKMMRDLKNEL